MTVALLAAGAEAAAQTEPAEPEDDSADEDDEVWPLAIIDRPLTLPAGWGSAGLFVEADRELSEIAGGATGMWGVSYGVTDELSLGVGYALTLREIDGRGPLDVNAGYLVFEEGPLSLIAAGRYSHDFFEGGDEIAAGLLAYMVIAERFGLASYGEQVVYGIDDESVSLALPLTAAAQITERVYAEMSITAFELGVANADHLIFGRDQSEIELALCVAPTRWLDLGAYVFADFELGLDESLGFGLSAIVNRPVR